MLLSFNTWGLGGKTKNQHLRALIKSLGLDIILLQETICISSLTLLAFSKILPSQEFCVISASVISGDLLTAWNLHKVKCRAFQTCAGLLVQVCIRGMSTPISILNVYGPYRDREPFWEKALRGGLLRILNLILGGDLNLTLYSSEI